MASASDIKWESRRQDERIATNADQAEFAAVRYLSANVESGVFDDRVAGALEDYEVSDPRIPESIQKWVWARDDMTLDNATSDIGVEVRRRQSVLGKCYPFKIEENRLIYQQSQSLVYEFCLAVSEAPNLTAGQGARLPRTFERLVRDVLIAFLGPGAAGFRTGWPVDDGERRPERFRDVIRELNARTGEWYWSPESGLPDDPEPQDVKDEGLDFVVWKDLLDNRPGKLFFLGQCACGKDYVTKFNDIDRDFSRLQKWVRPISFAQPVRVFTTPRHIPNDIYFREVNKQAGLTLDRCRITLLAEENEQRFKTLRALFEELIKVVIDGFRADSQVQKRQRRKVAAGRRSR